MIYMAHNGVGEEAPEGECGRRTGEGLATTTLVRLDKGVDGNQVVRARLAARCVKVTGAAHGVLLAAMPPLEASNRSFRMAVKVGLVWGRGRWQRRKWCLLWM